MMEINAAKSADFDDARLLLQEYADWLDMEITYRNIGMELADFPGEYGPPDGIFYIARWNGNAAGCSGVRRWSQGICELKRMFVLESYRGKGIGRGLLEHCVEAARRIGYRKMRLDTLYYMEEATKLYKSYGFTEIQKYRQSPIEDAFYLELQL